MAEAVARLRDGGLVAFPTETVYGLGANALDAAAVAGIFAAKGRPATNPLIVHVANTDAARALAATWPDAADKVASWFWPGPLTVVVERADAVPDIVTAGGSTVGLRVPDHPIALELLGRSQLPIAAPSANRSEEVSPTTAEHVAESLGPWVDDLLILDGGPTRVGIESTVVDLTGSTLRLLRSGAVTAGDLCAATRMGFDSFADLHGPKRAPGMSRRHYAPRAQVILVPESDIPALRDGDAAMAWHSDPRNSHGRDVYRMPREQAEYAAALYATLRRIDATGYRRIFVELPPPNWEAVRDRLRRAAAPKE